MRMPTQPSFVRGRWQFSVIILLYKTFLGIFLLHWIVTRLTVYILHLWVKNTESRTNKDIRNTRKYIFIPCHIERTQCSAFVYQPLYQGRQVGRSPSIVNPYLKPFLNLHMNLHEKKMVYEPFSSYEGSCKYSYVGSSGGSSKFIYQKAHAVLMIQLQGITDFCMLFPWWAFGPQLNLTTFSIGCCDKCGAKFPDEPDLYDKHFWFKHRPNVCQLKYSVCNSEPSDDDHPFSRWYVACDKWFPHHLELWPVFVEFCPRKPSGFKSSKFQFHNCN